MLIEERRRAALKGSSVDPLLIAEVGHSPSAEDEASVEPAPVRYVLSELSAEDRQLAEARSADILVAHAPILRGWPGGPVWVSSRAR